MEIIIAQIHKINSKIKTIIFHNGMQAGQIFQAIINVIKIKTIVKIKLTGIIYKITGLNNPLKIIIITILINKIKIMLINKVQMQIIPI